MDEIETGISVILIFETFRPILALGIWGIL